jgi:signal transduction histidine kinase
MRGLCAAMMMRYALPVGKGIQHSSGRVIALGRLLLAILFLGAIWTDASQPARFPYATFAILGAYIAFAAIVTAITWNNWWRDARLAGPAHTIDIAMFATIVLLTEGYTSPFFAFFTFVLLSAAIRWGWRATALTATLLALIYLLVGIGALFSGEQVEVDRFIVRAGQLAIVSLILIWFGAQRWSGLDSGTRVPVGQPSLDESPLETGLRAAIARTHATAGAFVWRDHVRPVFTGLVINDGSVRSVDILPKEVSAVVETSSFLYDFANNRALRKDEERNLIELDLLRIIGGSASTELNLSKGLAIPMHSDGGEGALFLESKHGFSTDHIDLGEQIAAETETHLQRHALLKAAQESIEARFRLTLARDLHDSVVQFLAGAAFRLEAMKRSNASGHNIDTELNELKQLMLQEQKELRSFIASLRGGALAAYQDLAADLEALSGRLSRQWAIDCEFKVKPAKIMIPIRLRLDAHQLMREAVSNAARHAAAKAVTIGLAASEDGLKLEFVNDGANFPVRGGRMDDPSSLRERVEQAGGTMDVSRGMGVTKISISLPIAEGGR